MAMDDDCSFRNQNLSDFDWKSHNQLREAIQNGNINLVKQLINNGAPVNIESCRLSFSYYSPLHLAVQSRSLEIVNILLHNGADVCGGESLNKDTPLTLAAKTGNTVVIDLLLTHCKQNHENKDNLSHLHIACMRNKVDIVEKLLLVDQGAYINKKVKMDAMTYAGYSSIHFSVQCESVETIKLLLRCGVDITIQDSRQMTPLHLAHLQRHEKIIDLLLAAHLYEHTNPMDGQGLSHFHIACTRNDASIVEHFLSLGVNINLKTKEKWRPITYAIFHGCRNVIHLLLECGAYLQDRSDHLGKLLASAFIMKNDNIYGLIKTERISFDGSFKKIGRISDLHLACVQNDTEKMEGLFNDAAINGPLDLNSMTKSGFTPLHLAVKYSSVEAMDLLLEHGADVTVQDFRGRTSLHIALEKNLINMISKITEKFVECAQNPTDEDGLSLFHILCTTGRIELIRNLILSGVDINCPVGKESWCWAGFTPMHFAAEFGQVGVVHLLLTHKANIFITNKLDENPMDMLIKELSLPSFGEKSQDDISKILFLILTHTPLSQNYQKITALHALCLNSRTHLRRFQEYLIGHKDEINQPIEYPQSEFYHKCTPLHLAVTLSRYREAQLLLDNGANTLMINEEGKSPLEQLIFSTVTLEPDDRPNDAHENLFLREISTGTVKLSHFHVACASVSLKIVKSVLESTADHERKSKLLNSLTDYGLTPLHSLLDIDHIFYADLKETIKLLLQNGADISARDFVLQTPFLYAAEVLPDILQLFLDHGAKVNDQNLYGETLLHKILITYWAFSGDNLQEPYESHTRIYGLCEKTILLLENGFDINLVDEHRQTCLTMMSNCDLDDDIYCLRDCAVILMKHVKKLSVVGSDINVLNAQAYRRILRKFNGIFDEASFAATCNQELELMSCIRIDSFTTLRDVLIFKDRNAIASYCENTKLQETVESCTFNEKFPIYGFLIRLQIEKGRIRRALLKKAQKTLSLAIGKLLPHVCIEIVVKNLSNKDISVMLDIQS